MVKRKLAQRFKTGENQTLCTYLRVMINEQTAEPEASEATCHFLEFDAIQFNCEDRKQLSNHLQSSIHKSLNGSTNEMIQPVYNRKMEVDNYDNEENHVPPYSQNRVGSHVIDHNYVIRCKSIQPEFLQSDNREPKFYTSEHSTERKNCMNGSVESPKFESLIQKSVTDVKTKDLNLVTSDSNDKTWQTFSTDNHSVENISFKEFIKNPKTGVRIEDFNSATSDAGDENWQTLSIDDCKSLSDKQDLNIVCLVMSQSKNMEKHNENERSHSQKAKDEYSGEDQIQGPHFFESKCIIDKCSVAETNQDLTSSDLKQTDDGCLQQDEKKKIKFDKVQVEDDSSIDIKVKRNRGTKLQLKIKALKEAEHGLSEVQLKTDGKIAEESNKHFRDNAEVLKHHSEHDQSATPKCNICSKEFASKYNLKTHLKEKHGKNSTKGEFICSICSNQFKRAYSLKLHIEIVHKNAFKFKCEICDKNFPRVSSLNRHMKLHTRNYSFACDICNKGFSRKDDLDIHVLKHNGIRPFNCEICSKSFFTKNGLNQHLPSHHTTSQFVCHICGKEFKRLMSLNLHIVTHTGVKKHQCDVCGEKFGRSDNLMTHSRKHSGEKPYLCLFCRKRFARGDNLKNHLRKVHNQKKTK